MLHTSATAYRDPSPRFAVQCRRQRLHSPSASHAKYMISDVASSEARAQINRSLRRIDPHAPTIDKIDLIRENAAVADGASIYLLDDRAILMLAPNAFPNAMQEHVDAIRAMAQRLTPAAGEILPTVMAEGTLGSRSFFIMPRFSPLAAGRISGRLDRMRMTSAVLEWLRALTSIRSEAAPDTAATFVANLTALAPMLEPGSDIARRTDHLVEAVTQGRLNPTHIPMHGDLWWGNIMRDTKGGLKIVDWGGSEPSGYGLFDLIRFAQSFRLGSSRLRSEIGWHRDAIGLGPDGPMLHLLAALGHFSMRLGEFPRAKFAEMTIDCFSALSSHE